MYLPKDDSFPCYEGVGRASRGVAPELDEVGRRLLAAAQVIRERGWCQGSLQRMTGEVCAFRSKHLGIKKTSRLSNPKFRKKMNGEVVPR